MGFDKPTSDVNSAIGRTISGASGLDEGLEPIAIGKPVGKKPKQKSPAATFLGADAEPGPASANNGGKTLLGM